MSGTAQAIVFTGPRQVELRTIHVPELEPDDVLIRTVLTGISIGTERWYLINRYNPGANLYPVIPGYLRYGIVEKAGANVSADLRPGAAVYVGLRGTRLDPADGLNPYGGCHTSLAVVHQRDAFPVPAGAIPAEAVLTGLAATSHYGVSLGKVGSEDLVVVIGQGMIGQMAAQICRLRGAKVITTDLIDKRVQLSGQYSADVALNPTRDSLPDAVARLRAQYPVRLAPHGTRPLKTSGEESRDVLRTQGADVVIDTSGNSRMFAEDVELVRREGRIIMQGYFPDPIPVYFHPTHQKAVSVIFPCAWDQVAQESVLAMLGRHELTIKPLITHTFKVADARSAYDLMVDSPGELLAMVLDWS